MNITREECIKEFKRLSQIKGRPPKQKEFLKETMISSYMLSKHFGRNAFAEMMAIIGYQPRQTVKDIPKIPVERMWEAYAEMLRKLHRPPSQSDWVFNRFQPAEITFRTKFNCKFSEIPLRFEEFAKDKSEYSDVIAYLPKTQEVEVSPFYNPIRTNDFRLFVPPIIQDIETTKDPVVFEKKVGTCFQLLGFKTNRLGQGQGQNPDGIASHPKNGFALIYDAKSHEDGYSITTSDRRASEQYIDDHREQLKKSGIKIFFFAFIAHSFNSDCKKATQDIREKTNVTAVLITVPALLRLVVGHIQNPYDFDHDKLKSLLAKGGQIDPKTIQSFLGEIQQGSQ